MIKKILVTTDFSETSQTAFELARQVAERFDGRITLLHVQELHLPPLVLEGPSMGAEQIEREHKELAESRVAELAKRLGPESESAVVAGTPYLEIGRFAKEHGFDMIVMATHGRGFFSHAILGSTTERVVRHASCPVLTIRDDALTEEDD
jgi:nucleotide-binding universal stress UspA family protein